MKINFWKRLIRKISIGLFKTGLTLIFVHLPIFSVFPQETRSILNTSNSREANARVSTLDDLPNQTQASVVFVPSRFENVQFPALSPKETKQFHEMKADLDSGNLEKAFPAVREFLLLHAEKFLPEQDELFFTQAINSRDDETRRFSIESMNDEARRLWDSRGSMTIRFPVYVICRNLLQGLPPSSRLDWQKFCFPYLHLALESISQRKSMSLENRLQTLKQIRNQNPCSELDACLLDEIALNAWKIGNVREARFFWTLELSERTKHPDETAHRLLSHSKKLPQMEELKQLLEQTKEMEATSSPTFSNPGWSVNMTQIRNPKGEIIFEDFLPDEQKATLFLDRKRDEKQEQKKLPQFLTFSPDGQFLVARMGTQVALWPKDEWETRPRAYLAILDLSRDGSLLGIVSPDSISRVLIGNPLADERFIYVPSLSLEENLEIALDIYALTDGALAARKILCSASAPSQDPSRADAPKYLETIFLPIRWTSRGKILIGGPDSGFQVIMERGF